mmetsp:Transcript_16560/g.19087  ORF Transcript_16560/g.19087 Transcript_16560/m.19087 type:complete len:179 (+) Transcript_16560:34-570(+)
MMRIPSKSLPASSILILLLLLLTQNSESLHPSPNTRRNFLAKTTAATIAVAFLGTQQVAAAIDISGLPVEGGGSRSNSQSNGGARGIPPTQLKSGPFANSPLGFQVGGGPRPEEVVRAIDAPRYDAARRAQGLGPKFLEGVPIEVAQPEQIQADLLETSKQPPKYAEREIERFGPVIN